MNDTLSHYGVVQSIGAGQAVIAVAVQGCASCGEKKSCGLGKLAGGGKTTRLVVPASPGLQVGATVRLQTRQSDINRNALFAYLLPALLLLAGAIAGDALGQPLAGGDAGAALGALFGLVVGLLVLRLVPRFHRGAAAPLTITSEP